jgi:hypothetical protein
MLELIAFAGDAQIAVGSPPEVAKVMRILAKAGLDKPTLVFDAKSGHQVDLDPRGTDAEILERFASASVAPARGRPRLGVVPREVTLLPRHWEWLGRQRGGASATLRRLVDDARHANAEADGKRQAREAVHRFITALAGDAPGYEEAVRALFAGDSATFEAQMSAWPGDVRAHALRLAEAAFSPPSALKGLVAPERIEAATTALSRMFGQTESVQIEPLAGRSGATILKVTAAGRSAVLRLDTPPDGFRDPARHYACHAIAAQAGVAPDLLHVNLSERLTIADFVEQSGRPSTDEQLAAAAQSLSRLHAAPLFPPLMPFMKAMEGLMTGFVALGILPMGLVARLRGLFGELLATYDVAAEELVSSHNDLNPTNILFREGRAIFVDWETAFAADRYVDLAALANFFAKSAGDEQCILASYFGRAPTREEMARLGLMRQVSRLYYGIMLLRAARWVRPDLQLGDDALDARAADGGAANSDLAFEVRLGCTLLGDALRIGTRYLPE